MSEIKGEIKYQDKCRKKSRLLLPVSLAMFFVLIASFACAEPIITLNSPVDGSFNNSLTIDFAFTPSDDDNFSNCSLWTNETEWSLKHSNTSIITNGFENIIQEDFSSDGIYVWNIQCYDNDTTPVSVFATDNYTLIIDTTYPIASFGANPSDDNISLSNSIIFDLKCSDDTAVDELQLWGNWTGSWQVNSVNANPSNDLWWNVTASNIPNGIYKWAVWCNDSSGNLKWTDNNRTFIINDTTIPQISIIGTSGITPSSAWIEWTTNEDANSSINYGTGTSLGTIKSESDFTNSHDIKLTGLSASTTYYYNVTSCDAGGNCNTSGIYEFTTSDASNNDDNGDDNDDNNDNNNDNQNQQNQTSAKNNITSKLKKQNTVIVKDLRVNSRVYFEFEEEHYIIIHKIDNSIKYVNLTIHSSPINLLLLLNKEEEIDINNDGINDISITLSSISSRASLIIKLLSESLTGNNTENNSVECPVCGNCSEWAKCTDNLQNRTCYECSNETNFICESYEETKECGFGFSIPISGFITHIGEFFNSDNKINYIIILSVVFAALFIFMIHKKGSTKIGFDKDLNNYLKKRKNFFRDLRKKASAEKIKKDEKEILKASEVLIKDVKKTEMSFSKGENKEQKELENTNNNINENISKNQIENKNGNREDVLEKLKDAYAQSSDFN